jgi:hypothetical protein
MAEFEIQAEGFSELMEQFDAFCSPKLQIKLVQNSVREAARPVKEDAERRLGRGKGCIAVGKPKHWGWGIGAVAAIGIGIAKKHWQLIFTEYGTVERFTKKKARRGKITARPFIRPALDSKKNEAVDRMRRYLELALSALFEGKQKDVPDVPEVSDAGSE